MICHLNMSVHYYQWTFLLLYLFLFNPGLPEAEIADLNKPRNGADPGSKIEESLEDHCEQLNKTIFSENGILNYLTSTKSTTPSGSTTTITSNNLNKPGKGTEPSLEIEERLKDHSEKTLISENGILNPTSTDPSDSTTTITPNNLNKPGKGTAPSLEIEESLKDHSEKLNKTVISENGILNPTSTDPSDSTTTITPNIPGKPTSVTVTAISSFEINVRWDAPSEQDFPISYTVHVENQSVNYVMPEGCLPPTLTPVQFMANDTTEIQLPGLLPGLQFDVRVVATTEDGYENSSDPITTATPPNASEPVTNLTAIVTQNVTSITWKAPCTTNGPITSFRIQLNGSRPHFEIPGCESTIHWNQSLDWILDLNNSELVAEAMYDIRVMAIGVKGVIGKEAVKHCLIIPPRIPSKPIGVVSLTTAPSSTSAIVKIPRNLFPDTEGTVKYYAILVAKEFRHNHSSGWLVNSTTWPPKRTWANVSSMGLMTAYQATPMWWEPFKGDAPEEQYEVGTDNNCSIIDYTTYCNGPLEPGTTYHIRIRGFTKTGYRDTNELEFHTERSSKITDILCLILMAFSIITIVIFANMVIKGNLKWGEDKKDIVKKMSQVNEDEKTKLFKELSIANFLLHSEKVLSNPELLREEFNLIENTCSKIPTQIVAQASKNVHKNRYNNILPYDSTRVVLDGDDTKDYINASHIMLPDADFTHYIACQGPKKATCEDFWRMVIQYKINVIVMLGLAVEKGMEKCFPYFPSMLQVLKFDGITVSCVVEEQDKDHVMRCFKIDKGGIYAYCHHMHFTGWPDFGVPDTPEVMLQFVKAVRQTIKIMKPVICVHCSAGVGRTGTFIAVDALLQLIRLQWNCRLNVLNTVLKLRAQRCKMVQTEKQYKYIYQCLKHELENNTELFVDGMCKETT